MNLHDITPEQADFYIAIGFFALLIVFIGIAGYRRNAKDASPISIVVFDPVQSPSASDWNPAELSEWYPPDEEHKPVHVGRYRVRMPWKTVVSIQLADWDGKCWRDRSTGSECYFQNLSWQGIKIQAAAQDK